MITGTLWSKPNRSFSATFLESIDVNSAYIMIYHYPSDGELINHKGAEICKAIIVSSENEIDWPTCEPPYLGFYVSNS
jgi:hypothetical protein